MILMARIKYQEAAGLAALTSAAAPIRKKED